MNYCTVSSQKQPSKSPAWQRWTSPALPRAAGTAERSESLVLLKQMGLLPLSSVEPVFHYEPFKLKLLCAHNTAKKGLLGKAPWLCLLQLFTSCTHHPCLSVPCSPAQYPQAALTATALAPWGCPLCCHNHLPHFLSLSANLASMIDYGSICYELKIDIFIFVLGF